MPLPLVVSDPKVMMGKPVIVGIRITVELLLEKLAAGEPAEQILRATRTCRKGASRPPSPMPPPWSVTSRSSRWTPLRMRLENGKGTS